ncbi:MAG: hypothetical protein ACFFAN_01425 [Promethearchaeota archaeon]
MSLDKWIKTPKKKEEAKRKPEINKKESVNKIIHPEGSKDEIETIKPSKKMTRYLLMCLKRNCAYQKRLMKKQIAEKDKICPRCKGKMSVKKL